MTLEQVHWLSLFALLFSAGSLVISLLCKKAFNSAHLKPIRGQPDNEFPFDTAAKTYGLLGEKEHNEALMGDHTPDPLLDSLLSTQKRCTAYAKEALEAAETIAALRVDIVMLEQAARHES